MTVAPAALMLAASLASPVEAASTIAIMPFDYSKKVKTSATLVRRGTNGSTWVVTSKDNLTIEFQTDVFTNKLVSALVKENKFAVVERQKLDRLIDEQKLAQAGITDPTQAARIGKMLGADYFIMTEISVYQANAYFKYFKFLKRYKRIVTFDIIVDFRVVDVEKGKIVFADKAEVNRTSEDSVKERVAGTIPATTVDAVQRELCGKLVRKIVDNVFPIKVIKHSNSGVVYLNRGSVGGVQVGMKFKCVSQGEALVDEDTGLVLGAEESDVAVIEVTDAQKKFSKAKVLQHLGGHTGLIPKGSICRPWNGKVTAPPPPPRDTTPPQIRILTPSAGAILNSAPVEVRVSAPDPDTASVTINGGAAEACGNGEYRISMNASEGANTITAVATDDAGNGAQVKSTFTLDTIAPAVTILSPQSGAMLNTNPVTVVVKCGDDDIASLTVNNIAAESRGDGTWQATVPASEGANTVTASAVDQAGNSGTASANFHLDTTPPSVRILAPKRGATINGNPVKIWVESPGADRVVINNIEATSKGKGRWMVSFKAAEGLNAISVTATDAAGNRGTGMSQFKFDSTPPEVSANAFVVVSGKVDDPQSTVTVNGKPVKVEADGSYSVKVKLGPSRQVTIVATDPFGNEKKIVKTY